MRQTEIVNRIGFERALLPLTMGVIAYAVLLATGNRLLADADTYWQIVVGQWMIDHRAVPVADVYSFTMRGETWRSTQWLAQILFSQVYGWIGWGGVVALTSLGIAAAFALLARFLARSLGIVPVMIVLPVSFWMAWPHFYARPHALALPVMVAWMAALLSAAERRAAPSLVTVVLMALWVNLHGSFVLGLALIAPVALDAVLNVQSSERKPLLMRWIVFGVAALAASCVTPYGWNALAATRAVLGLGEALTLIREWKPANFGTPGALEIVTLGSFALALVAGVRLSLMRAILFVGLLYMALAHVRHADVFALLAPMVIAAPLAAQFGRLAAGSGAPPVRGRVVAVIAILMLAMTASAVTFARYRPSAPNAPEAAVALLKKSHATRVFNDYDFGGYLIAQGMPTFIDGRTELYGEKFFMQFSRARDVKTTADLFDVLERYQIDATLLRRSAPAVQMLDQAEGWRKIFIDDDVVVHIRETDVDTEQK